MPIVSDEDAARKKQEDKEEKLCLSQKMYSARKKQEEEAVSQGSATLEQDAGSQLTKATKNSNLLEMSRLIETYPNCVHYTNNYGCTALHYACMANRVEPAKMLV